jgi:hypothetical protein
VEIYPKKKRPPVQVTASTASKPASGGTSPLPSQTTAQPAVTPASPVVTPVIVKEKSVLPWVVAGVACISGIGVFVAMLVLRAPDGADYNSLINKGGIAYEPDSEKPFEGKAITHYPNGQLMYEAEYKDGKPHGKISSFYQDGTMQSEGTLVDGRFHGKVIYYHPNGKMQSHYVYRNGKAISRKNWDETGKVLVHPQLNPTVRGN